MAEGMFAEWAATVGGQNGVGTSRAAELKMGPGRSDSQGRCGGEGECMGLVVV